MAPPEPTFDSSALEIYPSPPLSSNVSGASAVENRYLANSRQIKILRIVLSVLLLGIGAAVVGCQSHALAVYNMTALGGEWYLPLWPVNLDTRPAAAMAVAGSIVVLLNLAYAVAAVIPSPRSHTLALNVLFSTATVLCLAASIFALAYATYVSNSVDAGTADTIESWTCRWYKGAKSFMSEAQSLKLLVPTYYDDIESPSGFGRVCMESEAGYALVIALVGLEAVAMGVVAMTWLVEKGTRKASANRIEKGEKRWAGEFRG